ncbi:MAG: response regulator [Methyloligellaceae bacterium]
MAGYQIYIVDDHPLFRGALRQALDGSLADLTISEAGSLDELTGKFEKSTVADLVLLDLAMPGVKGFSGLMYLRAQFPEIPVVIVSGTEEPEAIRRSIEFGASGYIPKSVPVESIREAVKAVLAGEIWTPPDLELDDIEDSDTTELVQRLATLTPQQVRVLVMLGDGLLNKQIAYKLSVSEATVKAHVSAILQKLKVDSRTQAVIAVNKISGGDWQKHAG